MIESTTIPEKTNPTTLRDMCIGSVGQITDKKSCFCGDVVIRHSGGITNLTRPVISWIMRTGNVVDFPSIEVEIFPVGTRVVYISE